MKKDRVMLKRYLGMVLGVFIISIGIALFKESHLGNDPISALNMRLAEIFGISLGLQNLYANIVFLKIYRSGNICERGFGRLCSELFLWLVGKTLRTR